MKKKEIKLIDYFGIKTLHEMINTCLVIICSHIFSKVTYISGKSSNVNIKKLYIQKNNNEINNVIFKSIPICKKDTSLGALFRTIHGFFITLIEYICTKKTTVLMYVYTNPLSFPIILILNIIFRKDIIFTMHGELELQKKRVPLYKPAALYKHLYKIGFKYLIRRSPAYILVLGKSIQDNLCSIYPQLNGQIITINHPYFFNQSIRKQTQRNHTPLIIGTIGVMKKEKGFKNLIELSNILKNEIEEKRLIIKSIGKVEVENYHANRTIEWIGGNDVLPREEFEKQIEQLDYILYLYPSNSYKLTASGAIMDAIKLQKPIISLKNDFFCELLKDYPIGYLKCSIEELADVIKDLIYHQKNINFEQNFKKIAERISIPYNTIVLKEELKDKGII